MSADAPRDQPDDRSRPQAGSGPTPGRVGRAWSRATIIAWVVLCAALAAVTSSGYVALGGGTDGLIPHQHRAPGDEPRVLLRLDDGGHTDDLETARAAVAERLAAEHVPLAPPASEVQSWLDQHALYLLPPQAHEALSQRLTDEAMATAVQGLRARLSSPLFGVGAADPRRDPLGLRDLAARDTSTLGHVRAHEHRPNAPRVTAAGDLVAHDGRALLMQLRSERPVAQLTTEVGEAVSGLPVDSAIVGSRATDHVAASAVRRRWPRLVTSTLAGLTLVLALALRRVIPVVAVLACVATGAAILTVIAGELDLLTLPFLVIVLGFGCDSALDLQRISTRGWTATLVLASALTPLWIGPYPTWKEWSWLWGLGMTCAALVVRVVLPSLLNALRASTRWPAHGFAFAPMPVVAVLLALALLGGGAWATTTLGYQPGNAIAPGDAVHGSRDQRVAAEFFDPDMIVRSGSTGDTAAAALEQSAVDARLWSELVPTHVTSIDSPGSFVLTRDDLQTRRASLTRLELRQRMQQLEETLESRGLRPEAFGEFLRGAANLATIPSADAALDGPLGPWIGRYRTTNDDEVAIATLIELPADAGGSVPAIERSDGSRVTVHGPEVAARRDRDEFGDWLGVYSMAQLWLGAFIVWLGTRSFATAIAAAFAALATHSGLLLVMRALGEPAGPHMLPALLLGGSAALVAGARACRAVETGMPTVATGVLVVSLCQIAAGVALLASGEPVWTQTGLWLVVGCALASGTGLFVAPGFADMLRRLRRSAEANR